MAFKRCHLVIHFFLMCFIGLNEGKDLLFTPGPLTTHPAIKEAMTQDQSLTQTSAANTLAYIRKALLEIDHLSPEKYTVVPLPGSGTLNIEAVIHTATPLNGKVLVLKNGHFGDNLESMCKSSRIDYDVMEFVDGRPVDLPAVEQKLKENKYSTVAVVHHETSFSVMNPIIEIGKLVEKYNPDAAYVVDAVASHACYPMPMEEAGIAALISCPNKCLEAFPGMCFTIARKDFIINGKDNARSLTLNLTAEYEALEKSGTQRYTRPLQVYSALAKGIDNFFQEGRANRIRRYERNNIILRHGMNKLKFKEYRHPNTTRSVLLTVYKWPTHKSFDLQFFKHSLESEGMHFYARSLTDTPILRIANMGQLTEKDCRDFLTTVERTLKIMNIDEPNPE